MKNLSMDVYLRREDITITYKNAMRLMLEAASGMVRFALTIDFIKRENLKRLIKNSKIKKLILRNI